MDWVTIPPSQGGLILNLLSRAKVSFESSAAWIFVPNVVLGRQECGLGDRSSRGCSRSVPKFGDVEANRVLL